MKHIKMILLVLILLNIIGVVLQLDWLFNFDFILIALMFAVQGIRALIDPLNFDSRIKSTIPKSPSGVKWYAASIRIFLGIGCLAGSALLFWIIISG
jgi:hypothetical protein